MAPRRKKSYFEREQGAPDPIVVEARSRVRFSDVDPMGIVWYGRYPLYFEEGFAELGRYCGISYLDFYKANLRAPVIKYHIDYYEPLHLDELFTIKTSLVWCDGAKLNIEYELIKDNGTVSSTGYTVELITDVKGEVCLVPPPLIIECRKRWKNGEFY